MYQSNIYEYLETLQEAKLLICKDDKEATQIGDIARFLGYHPFILPDIRVSPGDDMRPYGEELKQLFSQLGSYHACREKKLLISPLRSLLFPLPKPHCFQTREIAFADTLPFQKLKETLYHWGYHFVDIASEQGEVSFRGDIIDIYPVGAAYPYRI